MSFYSSLLLTAVAHETLIAATLLLCKVLRRLVSCREGLIYQSPVADNEESCCGAIQLASARSEPNAHSVWRLDSSLQVLSTEQRCSQPNFDPSRISSLIPHLEFDCIHHQLNLTHFVLYTPESLQHTEHQ